MPEKQSTAADDCPACGELSYRGGYCFGCGRFRPSKRADTTEVEALDTCDFMQRSYGTQLTDPEKTEEDLDETQARQEIRAKHRPREKDAGRWRSVVVLDERHDEEAALLVQAVVQSYGSTPEGDLVKAIVLPWRAIVNKLQKDWSHASEIPPRIWEEMIAAAFEQDGYDEVILTPRSGDHGRDVVAVKKGIGCIRIIDSVKAYAPHRLVRHDDVRALAGVLYGDPRASKGIVTTTSDFAPGIATDPYLSPLMPYRLELMNGTALRTWLGGLSK
jgi:restriction system protein